MSADGPAARALGGVVPELPARRNLEVEARGAASDCGRTFRKLSRAVAARPARGCCRVLIARDTPGPSRRGWDEQSYSSVG